ncbi:hydroxyethylthiazole kinase [Secundilactobacillus oryzae JCM 18671]|uniref:Hydroxyethylthiazole kinase n=1 Tax=Secundilactobacillus oryzae JCM 18671 TaxID=1291743 RepID=A0A081BHF4_9LACO|nr:hydroxyethylthiazole kinase [Secundilactobacillus oryzae]GAK47472.1 hydroxyethylthiazole kinase [Secundilactobacillus oryzae JCM 18671]
MKLSLLNELRAQNPIVLNVSNFVTVQDVANGINAIGASPIMSEEIAKTEAMVKMSGAVALNLGAFTQDQVAHVRKMGQLANQYGKPVILDPVAVGAVAYRLGVAQSLLRDFQVSVIRGNAGEIAALAGIQWAAKGIDAGEGQGDLKAIARSAALKHNCVVILSGPTDFITDGTTVVTVKNGTPLFQLHVGSGDMLSSIVGAFAAVTDDAFEAAQTACLVFGTTGQLVAEAIGAELPGTFTVKLMDQLHLVTTQEIEAVADYE